MLESKVPILLQTVALLTVSNVFMTFAWYAQRYDRMLWTVI
ncbi:MAG: DMT family protein [Planctomycetota bacterium]